MSVLAWTQMLEHENQVIVAQACAQIDVPPTGLLLIIKECVSRIHEAAADGLLLAWILLNGPCVPHVFSSSRTIRSILQCAHCMLI